MHPVAICPEVGRLHRVARHNLQQANHARRTIDYYRIHPEVDPYTPVVELRHKATIAAERASEALMLLNYKLLDSGLEPGQLVEIGDHVYRVAPPHRSAIWTGQSPPSAEIPMDEEPEGEPSSEVVSAWAYDYAQATRWEG
jgi:hypothetical protein